MDLLTADWIDEMIEDEDEDFYEDLSSSEHYEIEHVEY